jgi:hypothetical protein
VARDFVPNFGCGRRHDVKIPGVGGQEVTSTFNFNKNCDSTGAIL